MRHYVDLSLFYFVHEADGFVLWGEGLVTSDRRAATMSSTNLGDGLRLLRVTNDFDGVTNVLQQPVFNYRHQGTTAIRFGLKPRPPVMVLPAWGTLGTSSTSYMYQFVRQNKADALGGSPSGPAVSREILTRVLMRAQAVLGLNFRETDASRLGDVMLIGDAATEPPPISITTLGAAGSSPEGVRVDVESHARQTELTINLRVIGSDDLVLDDVLFRWAPGMDTSFVWRANQRFGGIELRVWRDGRLLWMTDVGYILEAGINMQLVSGTLVLNDRLTGMLERAIKAGNAPTSALPATRTVAQAGMASQMNVGANIREPWRQASLVARGEVFPIAPPPPPPAEYFPQGGGGRAAAIQAFVKLLHEGKAFLVDPYFDALGAADLLPRIARDVDLTVVTSLPDDETRSCERLVAYLHEARGHLPFGIRIHRVTRQGSSEAAFHDRYLIVMHPENPPRGFLLSNSFSGLARQYPMVVAPMSVGTTAAVLEDIETLLSSKNISTLWPPPPSLPRRHDPFGEGWQWYLERLLPRGGHRIESWLARANAEHWLQIDPEGNPRWSTTRAADVLRRLFSRRSHFSRLRQRRGPRRSTSEVPLGFRVAAVGERVARGLETNAEEVASLLHVQDGRRLAAWLRSSFRSPGTWERYGHWRVRTSVRQALMDAVVTRARVAFGQALWSDTHVAMDLAGEWGRAFVYRVLLVLDSKIAVTVATELGDPSFIAGALDWWNHDAWQPDVSKAAIESSSAALKALGVQSLASPTTRGGHSSRPEPPSPERVSSLLQEIATADATVVVFVCLEWLPRVDVAARGDLMIAVIDRLHQLTAENLRDAATMILANRRLLAAFIDILSMPCSGRARALDALMEALAVAVSTADEDRHWAALTECVPELVGVILAKYGDDFDAARRGLDTSFDVIHARSQAERISRFRRHPEWHRAVGLLAFNQLLQLHLRARTGDDADLDVGPPWSSVAEVSETLVHAIFKAIRT